MRWPWQKQQPRVDPSAVVRERELEARTKAAERQALAAIEQARKAKERSRHHIRENHLGPRIAAALRENR